MVSLKIIGRKIDFLGNWIAGSPVYFFIIILIFICTSFIVIKIFGKQCDDLKWNFLGDPKKKETNFKPKGQNQRDLSTVVACKSFFPYRLFYFELNIWLKKLTLKLCQTNSFFSLQIFWVTFLDKKWAGQSCGARRTH